jgi:hypothetical protein
MENVDPLARPHFIARHLEPHITMRAYPLARAHNPHLELREWQAYARSFTRKSPIKSGLIGLLDARAYIHGLYAYSTEYLLCHKKTLRIKDLMMCHVPGADLTLACLDSIAQLACSIDITTIQISTSHAHPNFVSLLADQGYRCAQEHIFTRAHEQGELHAEPLATAPAHMQA